MFAEVILPFPIHKYFVYSVPTDLESQISVGMRVVVNFGPKKFYTGVVVNILEKSPEKDLKTKEIISLLDNSPIVNDIQLRFWKWVSEYYICAVGETMNAAIPAGLKIESNTIYVINPDFDEDFSNLSDDEFLITEAAMCAEKLTPIDIQTIVGKQSIHKLIKSLIEKKVIHPNEEIEEKYTPKRQKYVTVSDEYKNEGILNALFVQLEKRAKQQYKALLQFYNLAKGTGEVSLTDLNKEAGQSAVSALVKKNVFVVTEKIISRIKTAPLQNTIFDIVLSPAQQNAFNDIKLAFDANKPALLFGITGSGKTEIYIKFIQEILSKGKQVLYLLPEIALTDFMVERLRRFFPNDLLVYHSRFNAQEKVEIWNDILNKKPKIILGARSAIFLPFSNLGLIVVDEEHDTSYKQQDPAPRYNARDCAVVLAKMSNANIVLGSATPSIESWVNAKKNIYSLVELTERYGSVSLPEVEIIDIKQETFRKKMIGPLSTQLFNAISKAIKQNRQAILFQNRRGYSTWIECTSCGWMPFCKNCDVSMTYHKNINTLKCHYCGFIEKIPDKCPSCKSTQITMKGLGTQRVEDELGIIFPEAKIARMDFDSVKGKKAAKELFKGFDEGKFQILVGTQMVTKGLDFSRVDIVGIINADNLHAFPDYRAHEQAFQTMMQVAGRAGRRDNEGKTFIQVYNKANPIVQFVANADYVGFVEQELKSRHDFKYPPFVRLIKISVLHKDKSRCEEVSKILKEKLKQHLPSYQILGPEYPIVPRIRNFYIRDILLKLLRNKELPILKNNIQKEINNLYGNEVSKGIRFIIDVDPM